MTEQVGGRGGPPGPEGLPSCTSPQPHSGKGLKAVVELGTPQEGLESCPCGHAESRGPLTSGYLPCGGLSDLLPSVRAELAVKKEKNVLERQEETGGESRWVNAWGKSQGTAIRSGKFYSKSFSF